MIIPKAALYIQAQDIAGTKEDTVFKIITEPSIMDGEYGKKVECEIQVKIGDKALDDRFKWTINDRNRNALIKKYGDESKKWVLTESLVMPGKKNSIAIYDKKD